MEQPVSISGDHHRTDTANNNGNNDQDSQRFIDTLISSQLLTDGRDLTQTAQYRMKVQVANHH